MNLLIKLFLVNFALSFARSHTHDEIPKCFLAGVHKSRQTIIESPNYPNNYKPDTCWDYVIRSPYKCPTTFHIQFLDFYLEFSKDCKKDYLAIGLENVDGDDMDVLCGQIVGIKKYHTPNGVLRLRFFADDSPWTTGKGFKLLITRLTCETDEILKKTKDYDGDTDDDTIAVLGPSEYLQLPEIELKEIFRNLTGQEQYQNVPVPPAFGFNYQTHLPSPPYPATGSVYGPFSQIHHHLFNSPDSNLQNNLQQPCTIDNEQQKQLYYYQAPNGHHFTTYPHSLGANFQANSLIRTNKVNQDHLQQTASVVYKSNEYLPKPRDQYPGSPISSKAYENSIESLEACCVTPFQQKHFYLSSPGFPRTIFSNILPSLDKRDCVFRLQKSSPSVCRLRLDFKFFDFGQSYQGTGTFKGNIGSPAIQNTQDVCQGDFIEIESQRFCGCRSEYTFTADWANAAEKKLRMRMGHSSVPSGGFLLELVQEECSETQFASMTTEKPSGATLTTFNPNLLGDSLINPQQVQQQQHLYGDSYPHKGFGGVLQNNNHLGQQQQWPSIPGSIPSKFQNQNPFSIQQQQQLPPGLNNNLYPSQFGSNYFEYLPAQNFQHNLLQQQVLEQNPFGLLHKRQARSHGYQQPLSVVETNSTRKEYYYSNNDSLNYNEDKPLTSRANSDETSFYWDRQDTKIDEKNELGGNVGRPRRKCSFDMGDILRLSVDILWITKPICYAPQRNWFTNWIG